MVRKSINIQLNQADGQRDSVVGGAAAPTTYPMHAGNTETRGASPSNTAPANCTDSLSGTTILRTGIDSIYVSCPGTLSEPADNQLRTLKELAQSDDPAVRAGAFLELAGHRFEVRDKGKGRYQYVLADNWFHIQVSARSSASLPLAYCQVRSEALTCEGFKPVMVRLVSVLLELDPDAMTLNVSRVDLCADFVTDFDFSSTPNNAWVCRAVNRNRYEENLILTGFMFGAGGDVSARLYDKTREIDKSKKYFFREVWAEHGWSGHQKVWRLEFQFKRAVLNELRVLTVGQLLDSLDGLWAYGAAQWLQLKVPSSDKTNSRWPLYPVWSALQAAEWTGINRELWRVKTTREPDDHFLYVNGLGALSSFMAKEGLTDPERAMQRYLGEARRYHQHRSGGVKKALDLYLLEKTRLKATRFNKPLPGLDGGEEDVF